MDSPMLRAALAYLAHGWNVTPVGPDKTPKLPRWKEYQQRRATEAEVREWWARWPAASVAVLTGSISGIVVIDADSSDGVMMVTSMLDEPTLTVTTGRGGRHFYFKHPGGHVPNAVGVMPGVDLRGDGGYVVAPPSVHQNGSVYAWDDPEAAPGYMPTRLAAAIQGRAAGRPSGATEWEAAMPDGERDMELTRRAGKLIRAGMSEAEALSVLLVVNDRHCRPPLERAQVEKIVRSIAAREAQKPAQAAARPVQSFTVMSQRDMLRRFGEGETRWTVGEWLPEASCGLLVAPPGNYKTWLLAALAFSVSTGRPFLGKYPVERPGPVLFIQQEDPWWLLQSRLGRMFGAGAPVELEGGYELDCRFVNDFDNMPVYWYTDRQLHFSNKDVLAELERKVDELRPKVVCIDPLYTAADTKDYMAEGAQKMVALKLMRDKYGCSFIIAHHTTVAGSSSDDRASIWGSQFLNAWLEFGWRMPKGDDQGNVIIRHFKSCETPKRIRLHFRITDWDFAVDVSEAAVADRVEEAVLTGGGMSERRLAEQLGCSKTAVHKILKRLKDEARG